MRWFLVFGFALCLSVAGQADVYFEEEVVNPGFGKKNNGARNTLNKVYIKVRSQKVESQIVAEKKTSSAMRNLL